MERPGGGLVRPAPEGPSQDEGRRRRGATEDEPGDQAAELGHAEGDEELTGGSGSPPPFAAAAFDAGDDLDPTTASVV